MLSHKGFILQEGDGTGYTDTLHKSVIAWILMAFSLATSFSFFLLENLSERILPFWLQLTEH